MEPTQPQAPAKPQSARRKAVVAVKPEPVEQGEAMTSAPCGPATGGGGGGRKAGAGGKAAPKAAAAAKPAKKAAGSKKAAGGKKGSSGAQQEAKGPKRPTGAYLLFLVDFRRGFMQARPEITVTSREVASAAGAAWRALAPDLRAQYEERGAREKAEYAEAKKRQAASGTASQLSDGTSPPTSTKPAAPKRVRKPAAKRPWAATPEVPPAPGAGEAGAEARPPKRQRSATPAVHQRSATPAARKRSATPASTEALRRTEALGSSNQLSALAEPAQPAKPSAPARKRTPKPPPPPPQLPPQQQQPARPPCPAVAATAAPAIPVPAAASGAIPVPAAASGASAAAGAGSGFSSFVQECRSVFSLVYRGCAAPLPELVLTASQAWWGLPPQQRDAYAARHAQAVAANPSLGLAPLLPALDQHLLTLASQAVSATVAAGSGASLALPGGGMPGAGPGAVPSSPSGLRAMLESLLAADAGPPPALASLEGVAPVAQGVAAHAVRQAIANAAAMLQAPHLAAAASGFVGAAVAAPLPAAPPLRVAPPAVAASPLPAAPGWVPQAVPLLPPPGQALRESPVLEEAQQAIPQASLQPLAEQASESLVMVGGQPSWESDGGGVLLPLDGFL